MSKKFNIIYHTLMTILLTLFLGFGIAYGWYTVNKNVSATGIFASSASDNLIVADQAIYRDTVGDDNPYPDGEITNTEIGGLLTGDEVYYSITLEAKNKTDNVSRDISIDIKKVDGGEYFTEPAIVSSKTEYLNYFDSSGNLLVDNKSTYTVQTMLVDDKGNVVVEDGVIQYEISDNYTFVETIDGVEKEFYFSYIDGVYYKNYIYEIDGDRFNMCDVYSICLTGIYFETENGFENQLSVPSEPLSFSTPGDSKTVSSFHIYTYNNWIPSDSNYSITFTFKISFDYAEFKDVINLNCISNKTLVFNNIIISEIKNEEVTN